MELIDHLDNVGFISTPTKSCSLPQQVLDNLDRTGSSFREGLHLLREICSSREILPATYEVTGELSLGAMKLRFGRFRNIYKGSLGKVDVCIKRFPKHLDGDRLRVSGQVFHPHDLWPDRHALTNF